MVRAAFLIRRRVPWTILLAAPERCLALGSNPLDNPLPGPFQNLLILPGQIRWVSCLASGVECLAEYGRSLDELKRECIVVE
jgi:hypothetical protein